MSAAHIAAAVYKPSQASIMATASSSGPPSPSALPPIPGSPTYSYASTQPLPSAFSIPLPPPPQSPHSVLTKTDLEASQMAYTGLLTSAKAYRLALAELSVTASTFGSALEACARLKEARSPSIASSGSMSNSFTVHSNQSSCTADSLLAASGVHQLIANHQQILSETVYRNFEVPLLSELDGWRRRMEDEEERYRKEAKAMSKDIRKMEKEGQRLHGKRKRDVGVFREHLVKLTGKLDGLTTLHGSHARGLLREGQEMSLGIVECAAGLVRAEVDIFEALARKGWSGGGLDELLERGKDLFASEQDDKHADQHSKIFSILPNKSILADSSQDGSSRPNLGSRDHARSDSLLVEGHGYQSLAGAVSNAARDVDIASIFSEGGTTHAHPHPTTGILNRSRGVRPFSPPPMARVPVTDYDPLELPRPTASGGLELPSESGTREPEEPEESVVREVEIVSEEDEEELIPNLGLTASALEEEERQQRERGKENEVDGAADEKRHSGSSTTLSDEFMSPISEDPGRRIVGESMAGGEAKEKEGRRRSSTDAGAESE